MLFSDLNVLFVLLFDNPFHYSKSHILKFHTSECVSFISCALYFTGQAFAEELHEHVRKCTWGYDSNEEFQPTDLHRVNYQVLYDNITILCTCVTLVFLISWHLGAAYAPIINNLLILNLGCA